MLHESFQNPKRDVEFPPYELTEVGWGEFDIVVTVHFRVRLRGRVLDWAGYRKVLHPDALTGAFHRRFAGSWAACRVDLFAAASSAGGHCCCVPYSMNTSRVAWCLLIQEDVQEGPLELYHRLKLYDDTGAANPKKPVRVGGKTTPWWRGPDPQMHVFLTNSVEASQRQMVELPVGQHSTHLCWPLMGRSSAWGSCSTGAIMQCYAGIPAFSERATSSIAMAEHAHHTSTRADWHPQVVQEVYDEMVLWQPTEAFFSRYATHTARAAPPSQLAQFYSSFAPDAEYQRIQRARQRLAQIRANVENTAAQLEAQEAASGWAGA